ncbi:MAG: c-type cytochrome [Saprospiraceae bacterium]
MKTSITFFALIAGAILFSQCTEKQAAPAASAENSQPASEELRQRGEYLVSTMGCHDCHSPKQMGPQGPEIIPELMLSGYPSDRPYPKIDRSALPEGWVLFTPDLTSAMGPWGVSFAANITSDASGIGAWSEEQFRKAIREGKFKGLDGTRPLLPPMPWFNFAKLTDEDIRAIYTYLKSTPPVRNVPPNAIMPDQLN